MAEFKETCDFHVEVKRTTDKAVLVAIDGEDEHWIPLSQLCDSSEVTGDSEPGFEGIITVSEWIAIEKGLV